MKNLLTTPELADKLTLRDMKYFDSNFDIAKESDPLAMSYEIYIYRNIKDNFCLDTKKKNQAGPDFVDSRNKVYFECTVPTISDDYSVMQIDIAEEVDEDIKKLRYANSISKKLKQLDKFLEGDKEDKDPCTYVVCICGSKLEAGERADKTITGVDGQHYIDYECLNTPSDPMFQLLYGVQDVFQINTTTADVKSVLISKKTMIKGEKTVGNIHGIFRREDYKKVSAVIFTPYDRLVMNEKSRKSFLYININARNKITDEIIQKLESFCVNVDSKFPKQPIKE